MNFNKFLDFDKNKKIIYYNIYLNDNKLIVKIPLIFRSEKEKNVEKITIEKFDLINYNYDNKLILFNL